MPKTLLTHYLQELIDDFISKYLFFDLDTPEEKLIQMEGVFSDVTRHILLSDEGALKQTCFRLAEIAIAFEIDYVVIINQINYLYLSVSQTLIDKQLDYDHLAKLLESRATMEHIIAKAYLDHYLQKASSANRVRLASLNDMVEKRVVRYYEEHLLWLNKLIAAVKTLDPKATPELDASLCHFGTWLHTDAKIVIKNNSKYRNLITLHEKLHNIAALTHRQFLKQHIDYHVLMNYLEKCEMLSLAIGAELALIDNTIIVKQATKDKLTGALNRNALESIFMNQFELTIATDSSLIMAMCDLDNFKHINDTYGHVAGDMLLKRFVENTQTLLRDSDIVIRYGGEEFIILLPNTTQSFAQRKLNDVREAFQESTIDFDTYNVKTTVSIGFIEIIPREGVHYGNETITRYIKHADQNLYHAKKGGKNRVYTDTVFC